MEIVWKNKKPLPYDAWGKIIYMEAWQGLTSYEVNLTSSTLVHLAFSAGGFIRRSFIEGGPSSLSQQNSVLSLPKENLLSTDRNIFHLVNKLH